MELSSEKYILVIEDGAITEFYDKRDKSKINLAGNMKLFGSTSFTLNTDDITGQAEKFDYKPYTERTSKGDVIEAKENSVSCYDREYNINTVYTIDDGLIIDCYTENEEISQFGVNLELNFLGKKGTPYTNQLMPTSPYTSEDNGYAYCIMTRPDGKYLVCMALSECDGWKIDYSTEYFGHYIEVFKFLASFDKVYGGSGKKHIKVKIECAESLEQAYSIIHSNYNVPYFRCIAGGNFSGEPIIEVSEDTDKLMVVSPDGSEDVICTKDSKIHRIAVKEYGFYKVIPYSGQNKGFDGTVWYCDNMKRLYDLSCDTIKKPYHVDDNLLEGCCFLWSLLINMRLGEHFKYNDTAKNELAIIMGKNGANVMRKTILPYKTDDYAAYHVSGSDRIEEQFSGVSILLEAYKLYKDKEYLEFAISALEEMLENWMKPDGMIYNGEDYTTVYAPIISIVDMANILYELDDVRAKYFEEKAIKVAEFLMKRGLNFPTEGTGEDTESDAEDGSVSCTALSLLYVCKNLHYDKRYIEFAEKVLEIHKAWTIYSSDVKMNGSSFRWWETIWEGDGEGPAICAGHAWSIWKAEALYLFAILKSDDEAILGSWNAFITNFAKTTSTGEMYTCYEVDFIRGGGCDELKQNLQQLKGEDLSVKYKIAHNYPGHVDNSLSRYVWVRNAFSWYSTAAILKKQDVIFGVNVKLSGNKVVCSECIDKLYIGKMCEIIEIETHNSIEVFGSGNIEILTGAIINGKIKPIDNKIVLSVK